MPELFSDDSAVSSGGAKLLPLEVLSPLAVMNLAQEYRGVVEEVLTADPISASKQWGIPVPTVLHIQACNWIS